MAAASEVRRLTQSFRLRQARRAALTSSLVSIYLRKKVALDDPAAVERFLDWMVPKVLAEHENSARQGADWANAMRRLEIGASNVPFVYEPLFTLNADQLRASVKAVAVGPYRDKAFKARNPALGQPELEPQIKRAVIAEAAEVANNRLARSVARHVQNGHRRTIEEGSKTDPLTIGYVRVTKADPCHFCAMLASRGLEGGLYQADSFDLSDPRFVGSGTAKVHDGCGCGLKAVYTREDPILSDNKKFEDMWYSMSGDGDSDPLTNFRRNYEGRESHLRKAS